MNTDAKQARAPEPKPIRSPSYPNMSLREAVDDVGKIEGQYRSAPVDRAHAAKLIGYNSLSGPANKALAALASYGLLDRAGKGEARVSERARDILHAENQQQRLRRLVDAALEPELFRELRERFTGIAVPPEDGVVNYLNRQGFNPNAVRPAARAFLETMSYLEELGANESHGGAANGDVDSGQPPGATPKKFGGASVGDLVQWESNEILQLLEPRRVRAVSDDRNWVFVNGSETGIPMEQIIVEQKAQANPNPSLTPPRLPEVPKEDEPVKPGLRKEMTSLDEGGATLIWPEELSADSYHDLEHWLSGILQKAKRRAGVKDEPRKT